MKDELLQDLKEAMKNKDTLRKDTITMLRAAILQVEKDSQKTLTDDEICAIVAKEVKKRTESVKEYEDAGRQDIADSLKGEFVLVVEGNHEVVDYSEMSILEHVKLYVDDGMDEKEAIKLVAKERDIAKSIVYKEYHLGK